MIIIGTAPYGAHRRADKGRLISRPARRRRPSCTICIRGFIRWASDRLDRRRGAGVHHQQRSFIESADLRRFPQDRGSRISTEIVGGRSGRRCARQSAGKGCRAPRRQCVRVSRPRSAWRFAYLRAEAREFGVARSRFMSIGVPEDDDRKKMTSCSWLRWAELKAATGSNDCGEAQMTRHDWLSQYGEYCDGWDADAAHC